MFKQKTKTVSALPVKDMSTTAVFTAILCILAPMSIPIGPVPVSITNFVIYVSLYVLGMKKGTISYLIYMLIGLMGLPVFSGFTGGPAKLFGPTGGYLIGFIFNALIGGFVVEHFRNKYILHFITFIFTTSISMTFGTIWFVFIMDCTVYYALSVCVFPFIIVDILKIIVAIPVGSLIRSRLESAKLI